MNLNLKSVLQKLKRPFRSSVTYECEWCLGHGGFMVPDPEVVPHSELRDLVRGKITRVTVEVLGDVRRTQPAGTIPGAAK